MRIRRKSNHRLGKDLRGNRFVYIVYSVGIWKGKEWIEKKIYVNNRFKIKARSFEKLQQMITQAIAA